MESVPPPAPPHHRKAERKIGEDGDKNTRVNKMGLKPAGLASSNFVKVYMGGKERLMLLDSGCTHSVMPVELFDELDEEAKMTVVVQGGSGRLAHGAMIASHGKVTADMKTRAAAKTTKLVPVRQKFILAEVHGETVLGVDFYHDNKCKLDCVNYNAWVNDAAVTCYNQEGKPSFQRVHLVRKITIPGRTEMCVEGLLKMDPAHSLGMVESDWKTAGLLTTATLHDVHDKKLVVRVMNITEKPLTIEAGHPVGLYTHVPVDRVKEDEEEMEMPTAVLEDRTAFYRLVTRDGGCDETLPGHLKEHSEKWLNGLSPVEKMADIRLLQKYPDIFSKGEMDIGSANVVKHYIPLQDEAMPVTQKPYRHPPVLYWRRR